MTVTRFAPSPTGNIHVGNLRTALLNWMTARREKGQFILRIDDTDRARSQEKFVDSIKFDLEWLGLGWDRIERQSDRLHSYHEAADALRQEGRLYECFESPQELALKRRLQLSQGRPPVYDRAALELSESRRRELRRERKGYWRFLLDRGQVTWSDRIAGDVSIDTSSVSDPVLIREDGQFLYTLASVVDDLDMAVSIVIRGADHITNTAAQIQIMSVLGGMPPSFAHHALLTGPRGEPLGKRLGDLALGQLRSEGVEPMALLSLLARLGTSEPVQLRGSPDELADAFDMDTFGTTPTKFDVADVHNLSAKFLATLPASEVLADLAKFGVPVGIASRFWSVIRQNIKTRSDIGAWWQICSQGAEPLVDPGDAEFVEGALQRLPAPPHDDSTWATWTSEVSRWSGRRGRSLYLPLRKALTGRSQGPEMHLLMPFFQLPGK